MKQIEFGFIKILYNNLDLLKNVFRIEIYINTTKYGQIILQEKEET